MDSFWFWVAVIAATLLVFVSVAFFAVLMRKVRKSAATEEEKAAGAAARAQPAPAANPFWKKVPWKLLLSVALIVGLIWLLFFYWKIQDVRVGAPNGVRPTMEVAGAGGGSPPSAPAADRAADDRAIQASRLARIAEIEAKRYDATLEPGERQVRLPIEPGGYVLKYVPPIGVSVIAKCWTGSNDPPADAVFEPCGPNTIATWQILELEEPQAEPVTIRWWFEKVTG